MTPTPPTNLLIAFTHPRRACLHRLRGSAFCRPLGNPGEREADGERSTSLEGMNMLTENSSASPPRKRGAQPGNRNAMKHGFYSQRLREMEADAGLEGVIAMLRDLLRRAAEQAIDPELNLVNLLKALDTISAAADRLARLLRAQKELDGTQDTGDDPLPRVLAELERKKALK